MTCIIAIDPGTTESAWVVYELEARLPVERGKVSNEEVLAILKYWSSLQPGRARPGVLCVEMIQSNGMAVGREVFETCVWIGRFLQAWTPSQHVLVYRHEVKVHLCGTVRAKDGNIRQALIDLYGGKDIAIGKKACPGPLYGISADVWSALAIARTYADRQMLPSSALRGTL